MSEQEKPSKETESRRDIVERGTQWAMLLGLVGAYGGFAGMAARFLYPASPPPKRWMYVAEVEKLEVGDSLLYRGPSGETVNVARKRDHGDADDFVALSSTCPHLGCQVFWEKDNDRFFCPCHNGVFDPEGKGVSGPPGDAGQSLPRYPLKVDGPLLYIELPVGSEVAEQRDGKVIERVAGIHAAGHDPCLSIGAKRADEGEA